MAEDPAPVNERLNEALQGLQSEAYQAGFDAGYQACMEEIEKSSIVVERKKVGAWVKRLVGAIKAIPFGDQVQHVAAPEKAPEPAPVEKAVEKKAPVKKSTEPDSLSPADQEKIEKMVQDQAMRGGGEVNW